mmetsp:Transcript_34265/g.74869  ORF Transcript_34265/g.74869 Transcript_34265/m.74869 type:complete len:85 (+) Transcript_34265:252-506(+)
MSGALERPMASAESVELGVDIVASSRHWETKAVQVLGLDASPKCSAGGHSCSGGSSLARRVDQLAWQAESIGPVARRRFLDQIS